MGGGFSMRWLMIAVLFFAAACSPEQLPPQDNPVELLVTPEIPAVGEQAVLTLRNGSAAPVSYNLCSSTLMRHNGSAWEPIPSDRMCTMELRVLAPGEEDQFTVTMPTELAPGSYRFETTISDGEGGGPESLGSMIFLVPEQATRG
jgi:hypothetical protein